MSKPDLNSVGGLLLDIGFAGQVADMQFAEIDSFVNTSATPLDFGLAVCRATTDDGCKPQGADGDVIIGISVRHPIRPANAAGDVSYARYDAVPVMRKGNIFAIAFENVVRGDGVLAITAQGGKLSGTTAGAAGAGRIVVPGAKWETSTTAGQIGKIRINAA